MAKPRFPGKPPRLLSRNRTRISTYSAQHDDDTVDVVGNICLGLAIFKHNFGDTDESFEPGVNEFKGFTHRQVSESKVRAKRKLKDAERCDISRLTCPTAPSYPEPSSTVIPTTTFTIKEERKDDAEEVNTEVFGVPVSKRARRKGGGRKSLSLVPKQENPSQNVEGIKEEPLIKEESQSEPVPSVSLLPVVESSMSIAGHPLIVEGKRRWKPTYKVLQGPSSLEESRRFGGEAWTFGGRPINRAVEAPAPLGGKFVTGSSEKDQDGKSLWKAGTSSSGVRPSGGGILREARLRLDSAASGSEDGEWVRRMMDETEKNKKLSFIEPPKNILKSPAQEGSSVEKSASENESSPARVYCRICKGAMSRRFSKRKTGKRGVWSCKACREFVAEMTKKLRNDKSSDSSQMKEGASEDVLVCHGGRGKCAEEEGWPQTPPQRCVPCWLRLCLNAPAPHLVPCPVSRAALRKLLPQQTSQLSREPLRRGKKREGHKFTRNKGKRQKVTAEGPRVKHVCRSALAVLGRPPATFPSREPLKAHGGEAATIQDSGMSSEEKTAEGNAEKEPDANEEQRDASDASSPPAVATVGAHQWWKQRKGMHRRRKRGRLSLAMPRRDGRLSLHRTVPKLLSVAKPGPLPPGRPAQPAADLGPPIRLEGFPFRPDAAEVFTNGFGVVQVSPNLMPVQPMCFLCGSGGKQWLVHCALCCEPFHTFCVEWAGWDVFDGWDIPVKGPPKLHEGEKFLSLDWMCRRCSLCHACGLPAYVPGGGMPSVSSKGGRNKDLSVSEKKDKAEEEGDPKKKKKDAESTNGKDDDEEIEVAEDMGTRTCNICHRCYHGVCLGSGAVNQKNVEFTSFTDKDKPWVCSTCLRCHSCGKPSVVGSVPRNDHLKDKEGEQLSLQTGPEDILMCASCLSLHRKGNFCPLCHIVYRDSDFDALMMQCAQCSYWVHASCEGLSDDQYRLLSLLPSSVEFTCSPCTKVVCPAWKKAMDKKLRQGLEKILESLEAVVNAKSAANISGSHGTDVPITAVDPPNRSDGPNSLNSSQTEAEKLCRKFNNAQYKECHLSITDGHLNEHFNNNSSHSNIILGRAGNIDNKSENEGSLINGDNSKASGDVIKKVVGMTDKPEDILHGLKNSVNRGEFGVLSDFHLAAEKLFMVDEKVLSVLNSTMMKVFPWVKPKFCTRDTKKNLDALLSDHCYVSSSKTSDLLQWIPKTISAEKDSLITIGTSDNISLKPSIPTCDLQKSDEVLENPFGSGKESNMNEKCNQSKEQSNQNENLWMDPSDYIPNHKVYSFASALRRRSLNRNSLSLSRKSSQLTSESSSISFENDYPVTLEHSKNIVTYSSALAGIKKEPLDPEKNADTSDRLVDCGIKITDSSGEDVKAKEPCSKYNLSTNSETKDQCCPVSGEKDAEAPVVESSAKSDIPSKIADALPSRQEISKNPECSAAVVNKPLGSFGYHESPPQSDGRRCLFCHVKGDADVDCEGRLLLASSFGDWVHCNCALWSAEVYEEKGGLLMKVREAVNRGRRVRCALCHDTGATLGCCLRGCPDSYHLGCALRSGCLLLEDKSVYCHIHIPDDQKDCNVELHLKRPVHVDTEGCKGGFLWRWKKSGRGKKKTGDDSAYPAGCLRFAVGSLHVDNLGKILPGNVQGQFLRPPENKCKASNEEEMRWCEGGVSLAKKNEDESKVSEMLVSGSAPVVVPVGLSCTRLYWSSIEPWKIIEYHFQTMLVISEMEEFDTPLNEEKEVMSNDEDDEQVHVTVDHTAEDLDQERHDEESPDLIVPSDLSDEIIKDIPSDFFANKKFVHSILAGLLKGTSNHEVQNGVSHTSFEVEEEGNTLKSHLDSECVSPVLANQSDQVVRAPRHSKPVNVVQPVSKETLLSTESASRAWELTCEMRPAQTPPHSASPIMTGAAGNTPKSSDTVVPETTPTIWPGDSKKSWKHVRPIPQLDGNADPSSSSSEGGGSSPIRTSPIREAPQPIPCLLACRIKQQSLARSEPGGGGPVKCNKCKRTYRTREGYERHLCETPLPLSSTSSDSDSEDRTSRRLSSESDIATQGDDTIPHPLESFDCFGQSLGKEKFSDSNDDLISPSGKEEAHNTAYTANSISGEDKNVASIAEAFDSPVASTNSLLEVCNTSVASTNVDNPAISHVDSSASDPLPLNESHVNNANCDASLSQGLSSAEAQIITNNCFSLKESKESGNQTESVEIKSVINSSDSSNLNCNSNLNSENSTHPMERNHSSSSSQTSKPKEVKEGARKTIAAELCQSKSTKRQTALVQPLCYVNGKRRISSGENPELSKVSRFSISQEENYVCNTQQQVSQGAITQSPLIASPVPTSLNNNFQVLVRQLPSTSAVPQFAESFRQQTGCTLQYLATIDPGSFSQPTAIPQAQGLVSMIQGSQIMQTPPLVSTPQVMTSSPIVLAPQQPTFVYNPVTACLEAVPSQQQQSFILTPPTPTYTIPASSSLPYTLSQDVPQVYFQSASVSTPQPHHHPPPPPPPIPPPAPQLEPVIQTETGWSVAPGYHLLQNSPVEHPHTLLISAPPPAPAPMTQVSAPLSVPHMETSIEESPYATSQKLHVQNLQPRPVKKKRPILPNLPPALREGIKAYRRDEKTGKYIPLNEGWEEALVKSNQKNTVLSEEFCVNSGLSPAVFSTDVKDLNRKDITGTVKRKTLSKKVDGETSSGQAAEAVQKQGNAVGYVGIVPPLGCWRSPLKESRSRKQTLQVRVEGADISSGRLMPGNAKAVKRVESTAVMYQMHSADGLTLQSDTPDKIWDQIFNTVQEARIAHGLAPLPKNPFAPMSGSKPFMGAETLALSNKGLRYLLNQLPGSSQLLESKSGTLEATSSLLAPHRLFSRAHLSLSTQTTAPEVPRIPPPPTSPPLPENPTGCARSEPFKCPPPPPNPMIPGEPCPSLKNRKWRHRDIFGWLASPHRKLPMAPLPTQENEINGGGNSRRATSLDLPMAMRFRHLKETSREAVGVYRSHIHGRGLFCLKDIEAGEMVIEYSGEVIRSSLTDTREKTYEAKGMGCYMFRIDEQTVVDATMRGNAARFINHSCDPNCYSRVVDILGKKHILIFALRRIVRGEELTYDYKFPFEDVKIPCHCASKRCRKYLN